MFKTNIKLSIDELLAVRRALVTSLSEGYFDYIDCENVLTAFKQVDMAIERLNKAIQKDLEKPLDKE